MHLPTALDAADSDHRADGADLQLRSATTGAVIRDTSSSLPTVFRRSVADAATPTGSLAGADR